MRARVDVMHNQGIHFLIGRTVGEVFNPVVGGPDRVVNIESSARTQYDGLLLSLDRPFSGGYGFRVGYTLAKAFNYANDDQIPFLNGPIDPNDLATRVGPNAERPAPSAGAVRPGAGVWWRQRLGAVDDLVGRADGHHDARRPVANPRDRSATPAGGSSTPPRS